MYIVTYKNEGASCWLDSVEQFQTVAQAEKWVSENLPVETQKMRTGEYSILEVNEKGEEI